MKRIERNSAYLIFTATAVSGVSIWALKTWGTSPGAFGPVQHPLLDEVHTIHNLFNLAFLFMFGWLAAIHINRKLILKTTHRKRSGLLLLGLFLITPLSGQILLTLSEKKILEIGRTTHLILGVLGVLVFYIHSRRKGPLKEQA